MSHISPAQKVLQWHHAFVRLGPEPRALAQESTLMPLCLHYSMVYNLVNAARACCSPHSATDSAGARLCSSLPFLGTRSSARACVHTCNVSYEVSIQIAPSSLPFQSRLGLYSWLALLPKAPACLLRGFLLTVALICMCGSLI